MVHIPPPLLEELGKQPGFDMQAFVAAHQQPPAVSLRLNPLKLSAPPFPDTQDIPWCDMGYYLSERPVFTFDPLLHAGAYYVQEASSMFLWQILQQFFPQRKAMALDLCAAPGGKSTLLASWLDKGLVVANEVIKSRATVLGENCTKWGSGNIIVTNNDPKHFGCLPSFFDLLMIDAPCSGSGLFRREREWAEGWTEENLILCSQRQQRIIADAWDTLQEGGLLIYSTCSYSAAEDENILDWIAGTFAVESLPVAIAPDWQIEEVISEGKKAYGYRFFPHKLRGEGFFVSVFRKRQGSGYAAYGQHKTVTASKEETVIVSEWIDKPEDYFLFKQHNEILAIAHEWRETLAVLQKNLYLRKAGVTIGEAKAKGLVPAHDLALFPHRNPALASVELNLEQALQYLRRQDVDITYDGKKGWQLATYQGTGLGWMKMLPNRINNYYPVEWRILKQ